MNVSHKYPMLAVSSLILSPVACFGAQASAEKAYERSRPGASPDECASAVGRPVRSVVRCLALFSFLYVAYARWILDRPVTSTEIVFVGSVASMQAFWNDESTPPRLERTVVAAVAFVSLSYFVQDGSWLLFSVLYCVFSVCWSLLEDTKTYRASILARDESERALRALEIFVIAYHLSTPAYRLGVFDPATMFMDACLAIGSRRPIFL